MVMFRTLDIPQIKACMENSVEDIKDIITKQGAAYESDIYSVLMENINTLTENIRNKQRTVKEI